MGRRSNKMPQWNWSLGFDHSGRREHGWQIGSSKLSITAEALMAWVDQTPSFKTRQAGTNRFQVRDSMSDRLLALVNVDNLSVTIRAESNSESDELSVWFFVGSTGEETIIPMSDPDLRIKLMRAINSAYS